MQIDSPKVAVWIELEDLAEIRRSLTNSEASPDVINSFSGATLHKEFEAWHSFVTTDWEDWDFSEYDHDLACRYFIQLAIEHSSPETAARLASAVAPLDAVFKSKMRSCAVRITRDHLELRDRPYFWESHTIHPDQR